MTHLRHPTPAPGEKAGGHAVRSVTIARATPETQNAKGGQCHEFHDAEALDALKKSVCAQSKGPRQRWGLERLLY